MKMNYTNIIRPSKDEIDALEELGNEGWNWDSLLYYMKKVITYVVRRMIRCSLSSRAKPYMEVNFLQLIRRNTHCNLI